MTKVLNIMTGGINREGISSTQLEYMRHFDFSSCVVNFAAVHDDDVNVVKEFEQAGCEVFKFPDRNRYLFKYIISLIKHMKKEKYDVIHVHGSSSLMAIELIIARFTGVKKRIAHSRNTMCKYVKIDALLRPLFFHSYNIAMACGEEAGKFLFRGRPFITFYNGKDF